MSYTQDFIKNNNLTEITFSILDQKNYPYYNDGTTYYKDPQGIIYRITFTLSRMCLSGI